MRAEDTTWKMQRLESEKENTMKAKQCIMTILVVLMVATAWAAEMPTEPRGGQPPEGAKPSVEDFTDQVPSRP